MRTATLGDLVASVPEARMPEAAAGVVVTGLSDDTRELRPSELFVALPGTHANGLEFIGEAAARGAAAVVVGRGAEPRLDIPVVTVPDVRRALSRLSSEFFGNPSRELRVVGVTGTDGKTTTTYLTSAVLEAGGHSTGFTSTVAVKIGADWWQSGLHVTTPPAPVLQGKLREMADAGVQYAILETSSHGLALRRVEDVAYDVAVLTNVTSEHLEFHGTLDNYRLAKARLFELLGQSGDKGAGKYGIINADDPSADLFLKATRGRSITYGIAARYADVVAEGVKQDADGLRFGIRSEWGHSDAWLPLVGAYNVYNALAALSVGLSQGVSLEAGVSALERFSGVPGRMERIQEGQPFGVIVDYAHTADSLGKVLGTLRAATAGRLIAVFGSAGERDATKRPAMGSVAARLADYAFFTNEDPRSEDPMRILREIAAGAEQVGAREGERFRCIVERKEAIYEAFRMAEPGDMVLLAGKGHEETMELADGVIPWSDPGVAREALRELQGVAVRQE